MEDNRRTWAGTRVDISHAIREAVDALRAWSAYGAVVEAQISYKSGLTQEAEGEAFLDDLHSGDLPDIEELDITIRPDRDAYEAEHVRLADEYFRRRNAVLDAAHDLDPENYRDEIERRIAEVERQEPTPLPEARVNLRFAKGFSKPLAVSVRGPNRDQVEGLHSRLVHLLTQRQALRRVDIESLGAFISAVGLAGGLALGVFVVRWAGWVHPERHTLRWQEIVGMVVGAALGLSMGLTLILLYPRLEILQETQSTRAERFGKFAIGAVGAIVLGIIASAIYGHA